MAQMQYFEPFDPKTRGDEFGNLAPYRKGRPHRGQDWSPAEKSPIKAITNGRVKQVFWSDVLGWCLVQSTGDGLFVLYAHLAEKPTLMTSALLVGGETVIGRVGGGKKTPSGSASTGAHLHLSIAKKVNVHLCAYELLVDPLKHILANLDKPAAKAAAKAEKSVEVKK